MKNKNSKKTLKSRDKKTFKHFKDNDKLRSCFYTLDNIRYIRDYMHW